MIKTEPPELFEFAPRSRRAVLAIARAPGPVAPARFAYWNLVFASSSHRLELHGHTMGYGGMAGKPGYVEEWQASLLDRCRQICQLLATVTLLSGSFAVSTVEIIERKLTAALSPTRLKIIDESARHQGHVGARPGGETHFRVEIVAPTFEGRSRLDRHRMVSDLLAHELAGQIHALSLRTLAPSEDGG